MNENNDLKKLLEKEKEYEVLFEEFVKSDETRTFSKSEVEKILEAQIFKELFDREAPTPKKGPKNLLVTSKEIGARFLNLTFIFNFLLTYLFYIGFLVLINEVIYKELFTNKNTVFIIGIAFTLIDKFIKPFIFLPDLITFTFHRVGIISLTIYSFIFYLLAITFNEKVTLAESVTVGIIVLLLISIIDFLKNDSFFKTKYLEDIEEDSVGIDEDE